MKPITPLVLLALLMIAGCGQDARVAAILEGAKQACHVELDAGPIIKVLAAADVSGTASGVAAIVDAICTQVVTGSQVQTLTDGCLAEVNGVCVTGKRKP